MFKIFNEEQHADYMLDNGFMLQEINMYELGVLSKHCFTKLNYNRTQTKSKLIEFCKQHNKNFDPILQRKMLNSIVEYGKKFDFLNVDNIKITKSELQTISKINNFKKEKMLFVMLVFSKFRNMLNLEKDKKVRKESKKNTRVGLDKFFVTEKHSLITKTAKVSTSVKDRNLIFRYFEDLGLVKMTTKCNFEILFVDENSEVEIKIDNFKNLIYYYYEWKEMGRYKKCENCGCIIQILSNTQKYCEECAIKRDGDLNKKRCAKYYYKNSHDSETC